MCLTNECQNRGIRVNRNSNVLAQRTLVYTDNCHLLFISVLELLTSGCGISLHRLFFVIASKDLLSSNHLRSRVKIEEKHLSIGSECLYGNVMV